MLGSKGKYLVWILKGYISFAKKYEWQFLNSHKIFVVLDLLSIKIKKRTVALTVHHYHNVVPSIINRLDHYTATVKVRAVYHRYHRLHHVPPLYHWPPPGVHQVKQLPPLTPLRPWIMLAFTNGGVLLGILLITLAICPINSQSKFFFSGVIVVSSVD